MFDRDLSIDNTAKLLSTHGPRLRSLIGGTIDSTWVAWNDGRDQWFPDEAVIVRVGDTNLEIVCWKLSDIVLSWNAIDTESTPSWVADWSPDFRLRWRRNAFPHLQALVGQAISGMHVIEFLHRTTVVEDRGNPANVGARHESWLLHGIELELERGVLLVFNALDENGISIVRSHGEELRRIPV